MKRFTSSYTYYTCDFITAENGNWKLNHYTTFDKPLQSTEHIKTSLKQSVSVSASGMNAA